MERNKEQALAIVNALIERTRGGAISWRETAEEDTYRTLLKTGIVRIGRHVNPYLHLQEGAVPITTGLPFPVPEGFQSYGPFIFSLFVLDDSGSEVMTFMAANKAEAIPMETLWDLAFRGARNPDKKLQKILAEIMGAKK